MFDGETLDLFAYGTLRTGEPLHNWIEPDIIERRDATINGLLFEFSNGSYPVAVLGKTGVIHGEVFRLPYTYEVISCIQMEINAGYEPRMVMTYDANSDPAGEAVVFHFPYRDLVGERIPSGDWIVHVSEHGSTTTDFRGRYG